MSWVHLGFGVLLPGLLALHIFLGRRQRAQALLASGDRQPELTRRDLDGCNAGIVGRYALAAVFAKKRSFR